MRTRCITQKVKTRFGSMYISVDLDQFGIPVGGRIATPEKAPQSQIDELVQTLSEGLDAALKVGQVTRHTRKRHT